MDRLWTPWRYRYVTTADRGARQGVPAELGAWQGDTWCVFCNILKASEYAVDHGMPQDQADRSANVVYRGRQCFICLNAFPYNSGHAMILPYDHIDELEGLNAAAAQEFMELMQRLEQVLRENYQPDGINLGMNLGKAAGAGVTGHLHMHMLPRWAGDTNFMTVTAETRVLPEALEVTWEKLHTAFAQVRP